MHTYPMHSNVYLIPHWIRDAVKRHKLNMGDILDISKIRRILSMNDLLGLDALQSFSRQVFGTEAGSGSITYDWIVSAADRAEDKTFVYNVIIPLTKDNAQLNTIKERLFSETFVSDSQSPFEIIPLDTRGFGVVLEPGFFANSKAGDHQFSLVRALLKQLYVYEKHSVVAALPLYLKYLELLSVQRR